MPPSHPLPPPPAPAPLLPWLVTALAPMSRSKVKELLSAGRVVVNDTPTTRHDHPVGPGDRIGLAPAGPRLGGPELTVAGIRVVFEDAAVLVIDKPPGLLTVATDGEKLNTAFAWVNGHLRNRKAGRPFVVHRLDRDTSGLLLFARTEAARDHLQATWDAVTKTYLAVVEGVPRPPEGVVENYLSEGKDLRVRAGPDRPDARRAVSRYRTVRTRGPFSLVEVGIETGRKHQIRVHLAGLNCPVVGDGTYGAQTEVAGRLGLHAWKLAFPHPTTGARVGLESPLPGRLRRVVGGQPP